MRLLGLFFSFRVALAPTPVATIVPAIPMVRLLVVLVPLVVDLGIVREVQHAQHFPGEVFALND